MRVSGIWYCGGRLDRASTLRKDPGWVQANLEAAESRLLVMWRDRHLVVTDPRPNPCLVPSSRLTERRELGRNDAEIVFLGLDGGRAVFAVDVFDADETSVIDAMGGGTLLDLRQVGPWLATSDAAMLAYARGMLQWHRNHRFCGRCGSPSQSAEGGHMRACTRAECRHLTFPRTDPAVIMLVEQPPSQGSPARCLLAHQGAFRPGAYSTLAGFVEPGESLEEAVAREVEEETRIRVRDVRYQGSQPWPFPASIMLGFRATAITHDIEIDPEELSDARWFTVEELRTFGEWEDEGAELRMSRKDSISRYLVDSWMEENV